MASNMESNTESIRNITEASDEAANSYTKFFHATPHVHQPSAQASVSREYLPIFPVRDCGKCLPNKGLYTYECHRAFPVTLRPYIQAARNKFLPDAFKTESLNRQGKNRSEQSQRSGRHQLLSLISLEPDRDPTSSPETFTKLLAAFKVKQDAQVKMIHEKEIISDELYSTMMSHYHESPHGCELFHAWYEALKNFYRCAAEKWELKQAMEEMCVKYVEALEATGEVLRERNAELEREREERESKNRILELEMQNERVASLEAELREAKAKLSDLEVEREVN